MVSNDFNVYPNSGEIEKYANWGNLKTDSIDVVMDSFMNRKTLSLKMNYEMLVSYFALYLPDGFIIETPIEKDISEIANIQHQSFVSGISYEMFGVDCLEDIVDSLKQSFYRYIGTDPNLYSDNVTIIFTNFIFHNIT